MYKKQFLVFYIVQISIFSYILLCDCKDVENRLVIAQFSRSFKDQKMKNRQSFETYTVHGHFECSFKCIQSPICLSYGLYTEGEKLICDLAAVSGFIDNAPLLRGPRTGGNIYTRKVMLCTEELTYVERGQNSNTVTIKNDYGGTVHLFALNEQGNLMDVISNIQPGDVISKTGIATNTVLRVRDKHAQPVPINGQCSFRMTNANVVLTASYGF